MATKRDYYDVLGVSKTSNPEDIKRAYRQQALKWHPDRNKTTEATDKFKEINEAYEVLSNPDKKQTYDQYGHTAFDQAAGFGGGGSPFGRSYRSGPFTYTYTTTGSDDSGGDFGGFTDPFEIFESFFGGASPFGRAQRMPRYGLSISFEEAMNGTQRTLIHEGKEYKIKIPAGVEDGTRIRFQNFYVSVDVRPSPIFKREGNDLIVSQKISFVTAVLGGQIEVPAVDGTSIKIRIRPGTQPMTLVRLRGKGVPRLHSYNRGDLYVRLIVTVPQHLTREQKRLLEELDSLS
jgi:DnaJ-class molecular chaperone